MWRSERLRHLAQVRVSNVDKKSVEGERPVRLCNYTHVYYKDYIDRSIEFMPATATAAQIAAFQIVEGDTLITKDSETAADIGVASYVAEDLPGVLCGYHLAMVRPTSDIDSRFLNWALRSYYVREQWTVNASGVTRFGLTYGAIKNGQVPVPPLEVQRRIADFLDDQIGLIDGVLARRADQLGQLDERTIALVDGHLLRGEERVVKLAHVATLQTGLALNSNVHVEGGQLRPYLRVANVKAWGLDLTEVKEVMVAQEQIRRYALRPGDVLMTEGGDRDKLGRGTIWKGEVTGALHQNHVFAVRPRDERLDARYLSLLTRSSVAREYFEATGNQSTNLASTNASIVLAFSFPLPSPLVQQQMVSRLERDLLHQDRLRCAIEQSMKSLNERKRSLISAAVTGEFDVTSASSRAFEVAVSGTGGSL